MITRFREHTRELHEQIEKENQAKKIMDHSIDLEEYKILLLQNYIAYRTVEKEISRHISSYEGSKHQQLEIDLKALEVDFSVASEYESRFTCTSYLEALGAAYVVEGSALGGMVIAKELKECENLKSLEDQNFFSGKRDNLKSWNRFKKELNSREFSEEEKEEASEKAKETFRFFGEVFTSAPGRSLQD
ncbi:hypothetical protein GCM10007103_13810 [Salinimicrobium marinum]|uniref:Heme oxygenase n=1 Tax=Salinimicrobium marinum TaxID=680283 RepID=A0A918SAY4_9FLAO|nr:biliverdin-producing heme oxygenase [Salinimicrobium marinum]GHA33499.1 hypothetical protein GCM10007103_13810 [Salinimicrobium marinum]